MSFHSDIWISNLQEFIGIKQNYNSLANSCWNEYMNSEMYNDEFSFFISQYKKYFLQTKNAAAPTNFHSHIRQLVSSLFLYSNVSNSFNHKVAQASLGMRKSPLGETPTLPTFGPSGRQERLNC